jgi:hypothetical protein
MLIFLQFRLASHDEIVAAGLVNENPHTGAHPVPPQRLLIEAVITFVAILATPTHGIKIA